MNPRVLIAVILIALGVLGLVYDKFSYTEETHDAKLGDLELSVKEKKAVRVPTWLGIGAIAVGAVLLLSGGKKT
jgi:hypothetical protein